MRRTTVTYSIVARCPDTGMLGIGIASHVLAVGRAAAHDLRGRQSAAPAEAGCPQEAQQSWARITRSAEADRWIELLDRVIAAELEAAGPIAAAGRLRRRGWPRTGKALSGGAARLWRLVCRLRVRVRAQRPDVVLRGGCS